MYQDVMNCIWNVMHCIEIIEKHTCPTAKTGSNFPLEWQFPNTAK